MPRKRTGQTASSKPNVAQSLVISVDTGGTFTDCIWIEGGRIGMLKLFSTPDDPSRAIAEAVRTIIGTKSVELRLLHGTTVGTNALLQRKGAKIAFVTTAGFEDTIEIGRQARPRLYDLHVRRVAPLVAADLRFGLPERVSADGGVLRAPTNDDLQKLRIAISEANPQAIALSLLFS